MYVCMFGHAGRGNITKMAHTYIHTWTNAVSKRVDFSVYVCVCFISTALAVKTSKNQKKPYRGAN